MNDKENTLELVDIARELKLARERLEDMSNRLTMFEAHLINTAQEDVKNKTDFKIGDKVEGWKYGTFIKGRVAMVDVQCQGRNAYTIPTFKKKVTVIKGYQIFYFNADDLKHSKTGWL
jgi:hypothetical protein